MSSITKKYKKYKIPKARFSWEWVIKTLFKQQKQTKQNIYIKKHKKHFKFYLNILILSKSKTTNDF